MGQVTIYLDDESEKSLRAAAAASGVPVSRWIAELIKEKTRTDWPKEVRDLAGAWPDFPDEAELRPDGGSDVPREPL